mmetsp:Transcript_587/g.1223  ORF Transcript_587/g.1223 Transcript_587/m.1223 type:complete len:343 (-) Transcript_587:1219-2247(-)
MAPCTVQATDLPPRRSEGGGFIIADILSAYEYRETDPFLIWHELPKKWMRKGEFPGAPMHPHRGFSEVPYFKQMGAAQYTRRVGGKEEDGAMADGDVEWGMAAHGIEHGVEVGKDWEGEMHGFQLWVNLPEAHRMDAPDFQNAAHKSMPQFPYVVRYGVTQEQEVEVETNLLVKVLVGELNGQKSPVIPRFAEVTYYDFEVRGGRGTSPATISIPLAYKRRILYCYSGSMQIVTKETANGKTRGDPNSPSLRQPSEAGRNRADGAVSVATGMVCMLSDGGDEVLVRDLSADCMFLLITGTPLKEPCVQYGPFVMGNKQDLAKAFSDFQTGKLTEKPASYQRY